MYRIENVTITSSVETARRVRAARAYAGLSVNELASRIGLGLQTIKRIESGKRSARRFEVWAIAEACALPREFFEMDLDLLNRQTVMLHDTLNRVEERLGRIERTMERNMPSPSLPGKA
jgi:transcriptional regulator with XRE-family HTH domain